MLIIIEMDSIVAEKTMNKKNIYVYCTKLYVNIALNLVDSKTAEHLFLQEEEYRLSRKPVR